MILLVVLAGAVVVAAGGVLAGSDPPVVVGSLVALMVLAGHPSVNDRAVPRSTRLLLWAGLALLGFAVLANVWRWTASNPEAASFGDAAWFRHQLTIAAGLVAACGCLGLAILRTPQERLRKHSALLAVVGWLVLAAVAWTAANDAWQFRPGQRGDNVLVATAVDTGPSAGIAGALGVVLVLGAAAMTVLVSATLNRPDPAA